MKTILNKILPMDATECKGFPDTDEKCPRRAQDPVQAIESKSLFGSRVEVVIRHNGRDYRLRQTRLGKLILTA